MKALADETRLRILRLLAVTDLRVGELVAQVGVPQNALSYHLQHLRRLGLLRDRRSAADGRDIYYGLDWDRLAGLYAAVGAVLQLGVPIPGTGSAEGRGSGPLRVLFLCTHNSARSQLAEALLRQIGGAGVAVYSAGSAPAPAIHPTARALLTTWGIDPGAQVPKALEAFAGQTFDYVITVCDRVREICPVFPQARRQIHWSLPDPAMTAEAAQPQAFAALAGELRTRIRYLLLQPPPAPDARLVPTPPAGGPG